MQIRVLNHVLAIKDGSGHTHYSWGDSDSTFPQYLPATLHRALIVDPLRIWT